MKKINVNFGESVEVQTVGDIRFVGFYISQVHSSKTNKWYVYLQIKTELINQLGELIYRANPGDRRVLLYSGLDSALTYPEFMRCWKDVAAIFEARIISGRVDLVGDTFKELILAGYNPRIVKEICK